MRIAARYGELNEEEYLLQETPASYQVYACSELSNPEWLQEFNAGSSSAFTELYKYLFPKVYYVARQYVDAHLAEDITADAFCKLWQSGESFSGLQNIKTYLLVLVRHACYDHFRREKVKLKNQPLLALRDEITEDPYLVQVRAELMQLVLAAVDQLPVQQKKVMRLSYIDGLNDKAISELLNISTNTVQAHKKQALKKLRLNFSVLAGFLFFLKFIFIPTN